MRKEKIVLIFMFGILFFHLKLTNFVLFKFVILIKRKRDITETVRKSLVASHQHFFVAKRLTIWYILRELVFL